MIDWRKNIEMSQYKIKISSSAAEDLEKADDYIAFVLRYPTAVGNIVRGIRKQINKLRYLPESHELDDDPILAEWGIHKTYFKEYKIFFVINHITNTVYVIRILHMLVDSKSRLYRTLGITT